MTAQCFNEHFLYGNHESDAIMIRRIQHHTSDFVKVSIPVYAQISEFDYSKTEKNANSTPQ